MDFELSQEQQAVRDTFARFCDERIAPQAEAIDEAHEFLPQKDEEIAEVAKSLDIPFENVKRRVVELKEANPMLGHRGCRLGITFPEIYEMQVEAMLTAACKVSENQEEVHPEIMVPFISHHVELEILRKKIEQTAERVFKKIGRKIKYKIGTMIEVPRAALTANEIAMHADFFSFGTNDLTQMGYGLSRDDAGKFIPDYLNSEIFVVSPFEALDQKGIGYLVQIGTERGRKANPNLEVGICGEHGGEARSIELFHSIGLDYVSCSPRRLPGAWIAAAQANLVEEEFNRAIMGDSEDCSEFMKKYPYSVYTTTVAEVCKKKLAEEGKEL